MVAQAFNSDSKEAIRERILQNAATLWGLKNPQALDPFVKLLIEAFATEIFRLSNETARIEGRLVEKLARLLTPSIYTIPQPAHAIAYALPAEPIHTLTSDREFKHTITLPAQQKGISDERIAVNFTPVGNLQLTKMNIACIVAGHTCQWFDENRNKTVSQRLSGGPVAYGTMWLALDISSMESVFPKHLPIYFSNPAFEHISWVYQLLPHVKATVADHGLEVTAGQHYLSAQSFSGYEEIFNDFDIQKRIADNIKLLYHRQFISLSCFPQQMQDYVTDLPETLRPHFSPQELSTFQQRYLWLKLKFPPQFSFEILEQFFVSLNAFPVINRTWEQKSYKLGPIGNNIPIVPVAGAHFLTVQKVQDDNGCHYSEIPYGGINNLQMGHYSVKRGGMERYDRRSVLDMGNYLLELVRDEITAFSDMVNGSGVNPVKEMVTQMKKLEWLLRDAGRLAGEVPTYIVVEPQGASSEVQVGYWVTHGTLANNFRPAQLLIAENGAALKNGKVTLLTATRGGAGPQTGSDSINAYRYALTSRDRIVTFLDIKNFCCYELKDTLEDIRVKKGTALSPKPKEGFVRTTDIYITVKEYEHYPAHYWEIIEQELQQKIDARAVDGIIRRVFISAEMSKQ